MVKLTIDGKIVEVSEGTTILEAAKTVGTNIPTLCYFEKLNEIGACRVCVCEVKGAEKLVAACNTVVSDGIEVLTNSPRVRAARKVNVELLLSAHNCNCVACVRSGNCALQTVANDLNVRTVPYENKVAKNDWDENLPLQRDASKCISCMRCVNVCDELQGLKVWEVNGSGAHTKVTVRGGLSLTEAGCAFCGQCITHCPVGALTARDDTDKVYGAIEDAETVTVMQIAPAVRSAWADSLGIDGALATEKRMVAAAKALGVDYVFDTNFAADLTIMEEASELIERIKNGGTMPMFTSCCPGWVRFMRYEYPEFAANLSSAKSPQQMFGAVAKTYFAEKMGIDPAKVYCISVMPCSSKKYECDVPEVSVTDKDVDVVLTTREFARMLKADHVNVAALDECEFDSPLGTASGAGVIFGATGGVMEAALRTAYNMLTGENPDADAFKIVRGSEENYGIREAEVTVNGTTLRAAVVSGLANTKVLLDNIKSGKAKYDFVEVMACPGGCAGGGGQPITEGKELAAVRGEKLYELDSANTLRFSHENPEIKALYKDFLEKPLSHKAHDLLHTEQSKWTV